MGILDRLFGQSGGTKPRCADCGVNINILVGTPMNLMEKVKYSTQCRVCHKNYCSKCRPEDQPCQCGAMDWRTHMYLP